MTLLEKLKLHLNISDDSQDALLNLLLEEAEFEILDFTHRSKLLPKMENLQLELAVIRYTTKDIGALKSRSEGAISETYATTSSELPNNIQDRLRKYVLLKAVGVANEG